MADKEKSVEEFVKFTCCSEAEAKNYLENAGWNTEVALVNYFDDRDDRVDTSTLGCTGPSTDNVDRDSENDSMHADDDDFVDLTSRDDKKTPEKSSKSDTAKPYKRTTNIATLSSLQSSHQDDDDDDDDQLYYAGGSEHSGQQIMGNDRRGDVAGEVFRHLKQIVTVGEIELAGPSRDPRKGATFSGVGYRLGQTPDDTQVVEGAKKKEDSRPELNLRLYKDGFTIGEEQLRPYSDPENRETIESLMRGEVPAHLVPPGTKGGSVHVKLEDMRHERFSGPSSQRHLFSGPGHVLGNVVPQIVTNEPPKQSVPEKEAKKEPPIDSPIKINESEPTTNIAVRLPSGVRSQVRLNLTHTVEDLRRHITTVHPDLNGQEFIIMVSFPPKAVTDEKLSVADAGLINSSIHLRMKKN